MKFFLTFKNPDVLAQLDHLEDNERAVAQTFAERFINWQEFITVEFDTEKETAIVLKSLGN